EQRGCRGVPGDLADALDLRTLVVEEKEYAVALDRPAQVPAELVPAQRRLSQSVLIGEEVVGVQLIVAEILEGRAVELVRARPRGDRHHAAARPPILRRERASSGF